MKAQFESDLKLKLAEMDNRTMIEVAEVSKATTLQAAQISAAAAGVSNKALGAITDEPIEPVEPPPPPKPRRKTIKITAPSGGVYSGEIAEGE